MNKSLKKEITLEELPITETVVKYCKTPAKG